MKKEVIKKQYDKFHKTYSHNIIDQDKVGNFMFHKLINFNLKNKKVLDVGCGDGVDLAILTKKGARVFGIDPSIEFIKKAQINNPTGIFKEGVGENIPADDNSFDIVISKYAIQTSTNVPGVLSEIARVIKKNGMIVLLSKHPLRQYLEKIQSYGHGADYYKQKIVTSNIYNGEIVLKEPSHTIGEYFNSEFLKNFELLEYQEGTDFPASEQINGDIYPTFFIIKARRK